jgi:hypothetical protein
MGEARGERRIRVPLGGLVFGVARLLAPPTNLVW